MHDPRPASRYPTPNLDTFGQLPAAARPVAAVLGAKAPGSRVLRVVPAQVVRLELVARS